MRSRMAFDILSGKPIHSPTLNFTYHHGIVSYPFWADAESLEYFIKSPILNVKGIDICKGSRPIDAVIQFLGSLNFYNISDVTDPSALFQHFLYKRHFDSTGRLFHSKTQCLLEEITVQAGFTERIWVTKKYLFEFHSSEELTLLSSKGFLLPHCKYELFNIMQTNAPQDLKFRIENAPRAIIGGKVLPTDAWETLIAFQRKQNFSQALWCKSFETASIGVPLQKDATGVHVIIAGKAQVFYNISQLVDPLSAYRVYCEERHNRFANLDVFDRHKFSRQEVTMLHQQNKRSRFWIRASDMYLVDAECRHKEAGKTVECAGSEWYNLHQIHDYQKVLQKIYQIRCKQKKVHSGSSSILDTILNDPDESLDVIKDKFLF